MDTIKVASSWRVWTGRLAEIVLTEYLRLRENGEQPLLFSQEVPGRTRALPIWFGDTTVPLIRISAIFGSRGKLLLNRIKWPVGQAAKTSPFHGEIVGSIPARVTIGWM